MLELAAGGCAVEAQLNGMPLAALGAGRRQHQPRGARVHAGRTQRADAGRRSGGAGHDRRQSQPRVAIGPTWARCPPGARCGTGQSPADPERACSASSEWASAGGPLVRRAVRARREVEPAGQLPALALARRAADRAVNDGRAARHPRVPAAARRRARAGQSRAADRARRSCASTSWRSPTKRDADVAVQRFRDHVQRLYAAKALKVLAARSPTSSCCGRLVDGRLIECLAPHGRPGSCGPATRRRSSATRLGRSGWRWSKEESMSCVERLPRQPAATAKRGEGAMAS